MDDSEAIKISLITAQNVLFPLISGIGIIANGIVIIVITIWERYRANRTVANLFAVNLAVADLLFLIVLPLHMPALHGSLNNDFVCKLTEVTKYVNFRASILFLTMMSVDRFLAIVYTLQTRAYRSRTASLKVCIVLWVVTIAAAVPAGIYAGIDMEGDLQCKLMFEGYNAGTISQEEFYSINYFFNDSTYDYPGLYSGEDTPDPCGGTGEHDNSVFHRVWIYSGFVIFFLLPIIIILLSYAFIIKATVSRQIQASTKKNQNRVTIMVAVLVTAFISCWMPYQIWALMTLPPGTKVPYATLCGILDTTFALLAWSNSAFNPILYSISSQRFRTKAIKCWKYLRFGYQRSMLMEQQSVRTLQTRLATVRQKPSSQPSSPTAVLQVQENVNPTFEQDTQTKL